MVFYALMSPEAESLCVGPFCLFPCADKNVHLSIKNLMVV